MFVQKRTYYLSNILLAGLMIALTLNSPTFAATALPAELMEQPTISQPPSSEAQEVYSTARNKLLQVRTLVTGTGQQYSLGSAFIVDSQGLAITNYHVVSDYAMEPKTYELEYVTTDNHHGKAKLVAIDVVNDLAVIRIDLKDQPAFTFNTDALSGKSFKGERLYALGNPLNIGFAIVEGTYNGKVEHSYNDKIHFTGAINSGMSGGPAVTANNQVVGINVSKIVGKDLVSFLVPAQYASEIFERARNEKPVDLSKIREEISRQITAWQDKLYTELEKSNFGTTTFSRYSAPKSNAPWFECWSFVNDNEKPLPLAHQNTFYCDLTPQIFVYENLRTGALRFSHTYAHTDKLNDFQFSAFLRQHYYLMKLGSTKGKYSTRYFCHEDFLKPQDPKKSPPLRAVWCAQAYRDFPDIYDIYVLAVTQDQNHEALISRLSMKGVNYNRAISFASRFLGAIQWGK